MPAVTTKLLLLYRRYSSSFTAYPALLAADGKFTLDVIAPATHPVRHSVWIQTHYSADTDEAFLQMIEERLDSGVYSGLWCIDEPARELVLGAPNVEHWARYLPLGNDLKLRSAAVDKNAFYDWCRELAIPCPKSAYAETVEEARSLVSSFEVPFVVKGAHGAGGLEVDIVRSDEQCQALLQQHTDRKGWIIQEFVDGSVGTTTFVAQDGKLYLQYSVMNRVCMRDGTGPSMLCEPVDAPELTKIVEQMVVKGRVNGLTGFDWMRRADGSYTVIDPHFGRVVPNAVVAYRHGLSFDRAVGLSIKGAAPEMRRDQLPTRMVWVFPQALQVLFEPEKWHYLRKYNPLSKDVCCFFCGQGEWRLFLAQSAEFCFGRLRVLAGGLRARLLNKSADT